MYVLDEEIESNPEIAKKLPTGKVVGILERCWRNYVATLPDENEVMIILIYINL